MSKEIPHKLVKLSQPPLEEVAKVLQDGLRENFENVTVEVVECPDLTQKPFMLAAPGLCGKPRVADVGGVPYLMPLVHRDKIYDLRHVAEWAQVPSALVIGAGAGPAHRVGVNAEMIPNMKLDVNKDVNNTHICRIDPQTGKYVLEKLATTECNVLMNVFISEGQPGKVLKLQVSKRTGKDSLADSMRKTLAATYGSQTVAVGGTFCLTKGKAKVHVMPDFSETPINSSAEVDEWLKFFEMDAPLTATGYLVSHDPDLDLRVEHFHCFSDHAAGGHYHYDTTPESCEYLGYMNVAEYLVRVDQPKHTHSFS